MVQYVEALNQALSEEMQRDERVLILGEDIGFNGGLFGVTAGLQERFGSTRVIDMPISEAGFTGFAVGCAIRGFPTVVEIQIFDFVSLAMDQICNRAAKLRYMTGGQVSVPLVIRGPMASRIGLGAQHSTSLEGWFSQVPGLKVVMPSAADDAYSLLKAAICDPDPVIFVEHRSLYNSVSVGSFPPEEDAVIGIAKTISSGDDLTMITWSICVPICLSVAHELESTGVGVDLIDLRTIKPLDVETIAESVKRTGRALIVAEGPESGGFISEVATVISEQAFFSLDAPITRIGVPDVPVPYAAELEFEVLPSRRRVMEAATDLLVF